MMFGDDESSGDDLTLQKSEKTKVKEYKKYDDIKMA